MSISEISIFVGEFTIIIGAIATAWVWGRKLIEGMKCQLRSNILRIYYRHEDKKVIRQYEMENFIALYNAYKALGGNSFVDKIYKEVMEWEVIT